MVKPILTNNVMSRGQVDLIDMQSQPDEDYKFILNYQDHFSKFCVLRPLKQKSACSVAKVLVDIFSLMGPPAILQSDNGREFKNQEIRNEVLEMWPGLKMVLSNFKKTQNGIKALIESLTWQCLVDSQHLV